MFPQYFSLHHIQSFEAPLRLNRISETGSRGPYECVCVCGDGGEFIIYQILYICIIFLRSDTLGTGMGEANTDYEGGYGIIHLVR